MRKLYHTRNDDDGEDGSSSYRPKFFTPRGGVVSAEGGGFRGRGRGRAGFGGRSDWDLGSEHS